MKLQAGEPELCAEGKRHASPESSQGGLSVSSTLTHNLVFRHGLLTRHSVPLVKHIIKPHTMMKSDLDDNNCDRLRGGIVNMR